MLKKFSRLIFAALFVLLVAQSSIAANRVELSTSYFPNPDKSRSLPFAQIYVGIVDLDPEILANQKQISVLQESGAVTPVSQPISTNAGGVPVYNDSPVSILVDGSYSLKVLDKQGSQVYYVPKNAESTDANITVDSVADLRNSTGDFENQSAVILGYNDPGDGGGGPTRIWKTGGSYVDNGGSVITPGGAPGPDAWVIEELGYVDIKWFGATSSDSSAQVQSAIDFCNSKSPKWNVRISEGTYTFSGILLKAGVSILGSNIERVAILPANSGATVFSLLSASPVGANIDISGFTINCLSVANVTGFDFKNCNRVNLKEIAFRGCATNFRFDLGGWNRVIDCDTSGTATLPSGQFWVGSTDDAQYGNVFSVIDNYQINLTATGTASPACKFRRAVAMKINKLIASSTLKVGDAVLVENDCQGLMFSDCSVVGMGIGIRFQKGTGVDAEPIFNSFTNFEFDQNGINAILMDAGRNNRFIGCAVTSSFIATNTQAITLRAGATQNRFYDCHVAGYFDTNGAGWLLDGTDKNVFDGCVVSGSYIGITAQNNPAENKIINCDFSQDMGLQGIAGDFTNAQNHIEDCFGNLPVIDGVVAPTVPASGVQVTNNFPVPIQVFINGGTISNVLLRGKTIATTSPASLKVDPGELIGITYSVAPTWTWVGVQ